MFENVSEDDEVHLRFVRVVVLLETLLHHAVQLVHRRALLVEALFWSGVWVHKVSKQQVAQLLLCHLRLRSTRTRYRFEQIVEGQLELFANALFYAASNLRFAYIVDQDFYLSNECDSKKSEVDKSE